MARSFIKFHQSWFFQNASGFIVSMAVLAVRFLLFENFSGVEDLLGVLGACLFLILALPVVVVFFNRRSFFDVDGNDDAPAVMWNMARICSLLVILLNILLAVSVGDGNEYATYSMLPIILSGWIGINIGNFIHYRFRGG